MYRAILLSITAILIFTICIAECPAKSGLPVIRIGIVRDGLAIRFPENLDILKQEILDLTANEFDIRFPDDKNIHGNWASR
jgi:hypothetical protein